MGILIIFTGITMDNFPLYLKCLNPICDWVGREDQLIEWVWYDEFMGDLCPKCKDMHFREITEEEYNEAQE